MTIPTFDPDFKPSFPYREDVGILSDTVQMHKGYDETRAKLIRPLRSVELSWPSVPQETRDYILSFVEGLEGRRGPFWWTPLTKVASPSGQAPELSEVSGGALAERTYYVVYTWYDSTYGETLQSERASLLVSANSYLVVGVKPVPTRVDGWRLYAHETSGSECLQATVTTSRSWEQSAALSTGTATPPTSNTLTVPLKWNLVGGVQCSKTMAHRWAIKMQLMEQIL